MLFQGKLELNLYDLVQLLIAPLRAAENFGAVQDGLMARLNQVNHTGFFRDSLVSESA